MKLGTTYWDLSIDPANSYKVKSQGFPIIPYFSSTIDRITGKTAEKAKLDTGNWRGEATLSTAMKLYIGLSRVKTANDILLTGMRIPAMFTNGPFPWPQRLMQHLLAPGKQLARWEPEDIDKKYTKNYLIKDKSWWCKNCKAPHESKKFTTVLYSKENPAEWFMDFFENVMRPGTQRVCNKTRGF